MKTYALLAIAGLMAVAAPHAGAAEEAAAAPATKKKAVLLTLDGALVEQKSPLSFLEPDVTTLRDLTATIDKAAADDAVDALILHCISPGMGQAQASEVRDHLVRFRASGKPLVAMFDSVNWLTYHMVNPADELVITPVGGVNIYGIGAGMYYFRDTLEKIGVEPQVVNTGKFKTAFEAFTHREMSEGTRIQMGAIIEDFSDALVTGTMETRGMSREKAEEALWGAPYHSQGALASGLVTKVAYLDDYLKVWEEEKGLEIDDEYRATPKKKQEPINLFSLFSSLGAKKKDSTKTGPDQIALVFAEGPIVDGRADKSNPFAQDQNISSEDFLDLLDDAAEDGATKAIVLRVNSPGGSAIASDRIWNRLEEFQRKGVPVVVSMGDVAASGGYYIAMGADKIVAEPTTITGSIGVIGGRFVMKGLYEKLGVARQTISVGKHFGLADETKPWEGEELAVIDGLIADVYETFTSKVADQRGMTQERVKELGGGRVWTGVDAREAGLVDELGGMDEAIAIARGLSGLSDDASVVTYPKEKTFMEFFEEMMAGEVSVSMNGLAGSAAMPAPLAGMEAVIPEKHLRTMWTAVQMMKSDKPVILMMHPMAVDWQ